MEEDEVGKELEATRRADVRKRQQAWNIDRSSKHGNEPKEARRHFRESLQPGFYIDTSLKKKIKTLHLLVHDTRDRLSFLQLCGRKIPEQVHIPRSM